MWKYNNDELYHYGVPGMRWGVRKAKRAQSVYANRAQKQIDINNKLAKMAKKSIRSGRSGDNRKLTDSEKRSIKKEYEVYYNAGKRWIETRQDIMNMNVYNVSAKDIKKKFKDTKDIAGGVYIR